MQNTDTLAALSDGMADAVENVAASVVRVNGRRRRSGSGVVIAQNTVLEAGEQSPQTAGVIEVLHQVFAARAYIGEDGYAA
jgi:hypothetical protein